MTDRKRFAQKVVQIFSSWNRDVIFLCPRVRKGHILSNIFICTEMLQFELTLVLLLRVVTLCPCFVSFNSSAVGFFCFSFGLNRWFMGNISDVLQLVARVFPGNRENCAPTTAHLTHIYIKIWGLHLTFEKPQVFHSHFTHVWLNIHLLDLTFFYCVFFSVICPHI